MLILEFGDLSIYVAPIIIMTPKLSNPVLIQQLCNTHFGPRLGYHKNTIAALHQMRGTLVQCSHLWHADMCLCTHP